MTDDVAKNIDKIYRRRTAALYALCLYYSALALQYFKRHQAKDQYWTNQTGLARDTLFSGAYRDSDAIGWYMAHMQQYGVHLELKNNRRNESIRPIMARYSGRFLEDVKRIYGSDMV